MSTGGPSDVLVFEDTRGQSARIIHQLGLEAEGNEDADLLEGLPAPGRRWSYSGRRRRIRDLPPEEEMWQQIERTICEANPKVVVFDWLLSGSRGNEDYDGLIFGKKCKETWPQMGVILVTTGGDDEWEGTITSQEELDDMKRREKWPIDYAWLKPWGRAAARDEKQGRAAPDWSELIGPLLDRSLRPSEHEG